MRIRIAIGVTLVAYTSIWCAISVWFGRSGEASAIATQFEPVDAKLIGIGMSLTVIAAFYASLLHLGWRALRKYVTNRPWLAQG